MDESTRMSISLNPNNVEIVTEMATYLAPCRPSVRYTSAVSGTVREEGVQHLS